jgi:hypothetical protein
MREWLNERMDGHGDEAKFGKGKRGIRGSRD